MDLGISNRVAFVAASSQGLGKACALSLAKEGVRLALCSRNMETLKSASEEISALTRTEVLPIVADVADAGQIESALRKAAEHFGSIDILVNNAGGPPAGPITALSDEEWTRSFELTMMSVVRMSRTVLPYMERQRWGRIISIVSLAAKEPIDDLLISSAIRPGVLGLSKVLANQYGALGITVNTVCPGYILTQRQQELSLARSRQHGITVEEYFEERTKNIPAGRLGRPGELGDVVAFLASERASFINGANILVDGGQARGIM